MYVYLEDKENIFQKNGLRGRNSIVISRSNMQADFWIAAFRERFVPRIHFQPYFYCNKFSTTFKSKMIY
jgi:hypothetical protein